MAVVVRGTRHPNLHENVTPYDSWVLDMWVPLRSRISVLDERQYHLTYLSISNNITCNSLGCHSWAQCDCQGMTNMGEVPAIAGAQRG